MLTFLKRYWLLVALFILVAIPFGGYFAGYRVDHGGFVRVGTLQLAPLPDGTFVYLDESRRVSAKNGKAEVVLTPGIHSVIVDAKGNQPWNELVQITESSVTTLAPLLVPMKIDAATLKGDDATKAAAVMRTSKLPSKVAPLTLANGCAHVYVSGTRILADAACATPPSYLCVPGTDACASTVIYSAKDQVRALVAYPGRDDALVVAAGSLVYVIELDPREPQFFAPVFKGLTTAAAPWSLSSVVITNGVINVELPVAASSTP